MSENTKSKPSPSPLGRTLTKSRFNLAYECPTKLYYSDRPQEYANDKNDDPFLRNLARGGFQVGALAKVYFPGGHDITTLDKAEALAQTRRLLTQENSLIFEAAFHFENLFVRADIVKKVGKSIFLYEVKAKSYDPEDEGEGFWLLNKKSDQLRDKWKPYLYDVAFQYYVIKNAVPGCTVTPHLYLANKRAVATVNGLNQRFLLSRDGKRELVRHNPDLKLPDLGEPLLTAVPVTKECEAIHAGRPNGGLERTDWPVGLTYPQWLNQLSETYQKDQQAKPRVSAECKGCQFYVEKTEHPDKRSGFEECWTKALALPPGTFEKREPLFGIWRIGAANLLAEGIYFLDQLSEADLLPKTKPKAKEAPGLSSSERKIYQWEQTVTEKHVPYFDAPGFRAATEGLVYPLHFIDFETCTVAIPFTKGMRPYEQIAFQFSHHLLHDNGKIEHAGQWISKSRGEFPNFEFVRQLKGQLEKDRGTIFRYHSHENTVLNQIRNQLLKASADLVPDRAELVAWIETVATPTGKSVEKWQATRPMVDLFDLVLRFFWHPRMKGSNSIKVVLPAVLEFSPYLQKKYGRPIYGGKAEISSLNLAETTWVQKKGERIQDPYQMLPPVFADIDNATLDRLYSEADLADGGAATMAYAKMQFAEMGDPERQAITAALLRYCELDTLAMVMLWEAWTHHPAK